MGRLFKLGTRGSAKRAKRKSADWHVKVKLGPYRWKRARMCADKAVSEMWSSMLQAAVDRRNAAEPPDADTMQRLPHRLLESYKLVTPLSAKRTGSYAENVQDYLAELHRLRRDAKYIRNVKMYLRQVGDACGWRQLADVERDSFSAYLLLRLDGGAAPRTVNNIIATVKSFCQWAVKARRLDSNPVEYVERTDETGDRRRKRRALTPDEVQRILAVAGPRRLIYLLALGTGLRRRELRRLQWRDVMIDDTERPCLMLRTEATKSKRADILPLAPHLVQALRSIRPDEPADSDPVFATIPDYSTWHEDLRRAAVAPETDDGHALFHSFRVTFISELERSGVSPRTIMELARHRDYRLTGGTYTDVRVLDTFGAVGRLPDYGSDVERDAMSMRATGTDGRPAMSDLGRDQIQDQRARRTMPLGAVPCSDASAQTGLRHEKTPPGGGVASPRVGLEPTT